MTDPTVLRDQQGRTLGSAHDFAGWCALNSGHDGCHATSNGGNIYKQECGAPVALIGDVSNWKPTGFVATFEPRRDR